MIRREAITGVILCGGEGRRLDGKDKPLETLAGMPMVGHVRARLAPQVGSIIISANRHLDQYAAWGDPVVADVRPSVGPLGGISASLKSVESDWVFCCPGDAPFLLVDLVSRLTMALTASAGATMAVPHDGTRVQPLFALFRSTARESLESYLSEGKRSALGWTESCQTVIVDCASAHDAFTNVNTTNDLSRLEAAMLAGGVAQ